MFRAIYIHLQEVTLYKCSTWYSTVTLYERSWWPVLMYNAVVWQHHFYRTFLTIITLARLKYKLPDDGHRQKPVGAL